MTTQKLADGALLTKMLKGSFERMMGQVERVVLERRDVFGGGAEVEVRLLGTFPAHALVMNSEGEFFRAAYSVSEETGGIELGEVEKLDVPLRDRADLGRESRVKSTEAVDAILSGDADKAEEGILDLYDLVQAGVRLTAEAIEDALGRCTCDERPWLVALRANERPIRAFVGAEARKDIPKPRFEDLNGDLDEDTEPKVRKVIEGSLRKLRSHLTDMRESLSLAKVVDETYELKAEGDASMAADDFVEFVTEFSSDLDDAIAIVEDAVAVAADGTITSLARIHDAVAGRAYEMGLASAFAERFARRFTAPEAA